jgi:phosphoribosylformylglycinamidine (FGAM) synthase PurS component
MPEDAVWALEIVPHDQLTDPHARTFEQVLYDLGSRPASVAHGRLYLFRGSSSPQLEQAAIKLCLDPVVAEMHVDRDVGSANAPRQSDDQLTGRLSWIVEVLPHPGVTDAEGDSLTDALTRDGFPSVSARAGHRYHVVGVEHSVVADAAKLIAHDVVESVAWRPAS